MRGARDGSFFPLGSCVVTWMILTQMKVSEDRSPVRADQSRSKFLVD